MRIDNYARFLMTVITLCLVYLCLRDLTKSPKVQAQYDQPVHVILVDRNGRSITDDPSGIEHLNVKLVEH